MLGHMGGGKVNLGYEQLQALKIIAEFPDQEMSDIAKSADCSWDELFAMGHGELIDIGMERLKPHQAHPVIKEGGVSTLEKAEKEGLL